MKSFLTTAPRAKRQLSPDPQRTSDGDDEPTEVKLALLSSLHAGIEQETLLDFLLAHNGSVLRASEAIQLGKTCHEQEKKSSIGIGYQQSLRQYATLSRDSTTPPTRKKKKTKTMSKRGTTLHLYDPEDVAEHTPCTIIHNFLRADEANELLKELLHESKSFEKNTFKLFDNVVSSPHTSSFFVESSEELTAQKSEYYYNGSQLTVSPTVPRISVQARFSHTILTPTDALVIDCICCTECAGRSPHHTAAGRSEAEGTRRREQTDPTPHRDEISQWQEAAIPITQSMDTQLGLCQLLRWRTAERRLAQRSTHVFRAPSRHWVHLSRRRTRVSRPESRA